MIARQIEGAPESYPAVEGVTGDALATAWQRVEHYIAHRFTPRTVTWYVLSDGCEWLPPLTPIVSLTVSAAGEDPYEPDAGQMGGYVLPDGIVTVEATVGAGPVPETVTEAVRRYAAYQTGASPLPTGITRLESGSLSIAVRGDMVHPGQGMINSGAADLLRAYRRV